MRAQEQPVIAIAGAGNVGTFLANALFRSGCSINQVYSRNHEHATILAEKVNASAISELSELDRNNELIILALPDKTIPRFCKEIAAIFGEQQFKVASVSGSVQLSEISGFIKHSGVLYPLQSFTLKTNPDSRIIPVCIEGTDEDTLSLMNSVGLLISDDVRKVNSEQRLILHLSAVFASNFTNHMIALAEDIISKAGLDFNILKPLINETISRLGNNSAANMQTGPAIRKDDETINKHLEILKMHYPDHRISELYKLISESIIWQTTKKT